MLKTYYPEKITQPTLFYVPNFLVPPVERIRPAENFIPECEYPDLQSLFDKFRHEWNIRISQTNPKKIPKILISANLFNSEKILDSWTRSLLEVIIPLSKILFPHRQFRC